MRITSWDLDFATLEIDRFFGTVPDLIQLHGGNDEERSNADAEW